tara:strand:+ start:1105 stop:1245 length:141 start_codon:yes stop_codon:yes gene_type:complete
MTQIKAYLADNHDIVKALKDMFITAAVAALCIGTAPALIWLTAISF